MKRKNKTSLNIYCCFLTFLIIWLSACGSKSPSNVPVNIKAPVVTFPSSTLNKFRFNKKDAGCSPSLILPVSFSSDATNGDSCGITIYPSGSAGFNCHDNRGSILFDGIHGSLSPSAPLTSTTLPLSLGLTGTSVDGGGNPSKADISVSLTTSQLSIQGTITITLTKTHPDGTQYTEDVPRTISFIRDVSNLPYASLNGIFTTEVTNQYMFLLNSSEPDVGFTVKLEQNINTGCGAVKHTRTYTHSSPGLVIVGDVPGRYVLVNWDGKDDSGKSFSGGDATIIAYLDSCPDNAIGRSFSFSGTQSIELSINPNIVEAGKSATVSLSKNTSNEPWILTEYTPIGTIVELGCQAAGSSYTFNSGTGPTDLGSYFFRATLASDSGISSGLPLTVVEPSPSQTPSDGGLGGNPSPTPSIGPSSNPSSSPSVNPSSSGSPSASPTPVPTPSVTASPSVSPSSSPTPVPTPTSTPSKPPKGCDKPPVLSADKKSFVPNDDGIKDSVNFSVKSCKNWTLKIEPENLAQFNVPGFDNQSLTKTFTGHDNNSVTWDGRNELGEVLHTNYIVTVQDSDSKKDTTDVEIKRSKTIDFFLDLNNTFSGTDFPFQVASNSGKTFTIGACGGEIKLGSGYYLYPQWLTQRFPTVLDTVIGIFNYGTVTSVELHGQVKNAAGKVVHSWDYTGGLVSPDVKIKTSWDLVKGAFVVQKTWDGKDNSGVTVPEGNYIFTERAKFTYSGSAITYSAKDLGNTADFDIVKSDSLSNEPTFTQITTNANFKQHYLDHRSLLEQLFGKKYPKWKDDEGQEFLNDILLLINTKRVKYEGLGTLKKAQPQEYIFRGEGVTVVIYQDGTFHTLFKTGEGADLAIQLCN